MPRDIRRCYGNRPYHRLSPEPALQHRRTPSLRPGLASPISRLLGAPHLQRFRQSFTNSSVLPALYATSLPVPLSSLVQSQSAASETSGISLRTPSATESWNSCRRWFTAPGFGGAEYLTSTISISLILSI